MIVLKDILTDKLIDIRQQARDNNDYLLSDLIRQELDSRNCFVFDSKNGQEVYHMTKSMTRDNMILIRREMDFNFKINYIRKNT